MKKLFNLSILLGLFLILFIPDLAFSQGGIGITNGDKYVPVRVNSGYGFDTGVKGGSALEQLENMTNTRISTSRTNTPSVAPVNAVKTISQAALFQNAMKMQLASGIASALIGMIFSDNSKSNEQAAEAKRQEAILLAQRAAEEKRIADLIAQEKFEKMMKDYKLLNDPNGLKIKSLSTGNIQFKPLDYQSAPMTMEERQIQNIRKHLGKDGKPISLTWNFNEWANVSANNNTIEETYTREESEEDKNLNAVISKHESDDGGREAAAVGRFGKHFKNETMSYLNEVTGAIRSGDMARMMEVGMNNPAKLVSNSIKGAFVETKNAAIAETKGFLTKIVSEKNMAFWQEKFMDAAQGDMQKDWKMPLR